MSLQRVAVLPTVFILCVLTLASLFPNTAAACECATPATVQGRVANADVVFSGTMTISKTSGGATQMTFEADEIWKGPIQRYIGIQSDSSRSGACGWQPKSGVKYIVYGSAVTPVKFYTSTCSGNELDSESTIRSVLGPGKSPFFKRTTEPDAQRAQEPVVRSNAKGEILPPETKVASETATTPQQNESLFSRVLASLQPLLHRIFGANAAGSAETVPSVPVEDTKSNAPLTGDTFEQIFTVSTASGAVPLGFIVPQDFWVSDGKLAYIVQYKDETSSDPNHLRKELVYDGVVVPMGTVARPWRGLDIMAQDIGGKKLSVKYGMGRNEVNAPNSSYVLSWDGTEYVRGEGSITEIIDYNGAPAYILRRRYLGSKASDDVVMYQGREVSDPYRAISNLKVVGGKLAFLFQRTTRDSHTGELLHACAKPFPRAGNDWPNTGLVWDGKEYGAEYDTVSGFIDSGGAPTYIARNLISLDCSPGATSFLTVEQFVVHNDAILVRAQNTNFFLEWKESDLVDVSGNVAVAVTNPAKQYLYYKGHKYFTDRGTFVLGVQNANDKLVVLVSKDKTYYIFKEK